MISSERLLKMSEDFCVNENFFIFFSVFYGFYIIAFCIGTFLGYILSSLSCHSLHQIIIKMDVNWGRTNSNFFVYVPLLIFLVLLFIIILFYPKSHYNSVDKIKKSSNLLLEQSKKSNDCWFLKRMSLFSLIVQLEIRVLKVLAK